MVIGYVLLANTSFGLIGIYIALAIISLGTGFFKGNLQAMVGRLYDQSGFGKLRDAAFSLFYMGINIGAFFAPSAAEAMNNYMMKGDGFSYSGKIPEFANEYIAKGAQIGSEKISELTKLAHEHIINNSYTFTDLKSFSTDYIASVSQSYNYGVAIAAVSIFVSMILFFELIAEKNYKELKVVRKKIKSCKNKLRSAMV